MKKIYLIICTLFLFTGLSGQSIDTDNVVIDPTITEDESTVIIKNVLRKWRALVNSSKLSTELERDSFLLLFDFGAKHYVDFKETPIDMRMNVEEYVEETSRNYPTGMVFKVEDAILTEIGVAEDFNFFAKVDMTKRYDEYIDLNNELKFIESGLSSELKIKFSIDPYQLEDVFISEVIGNYIEPVQTIVQSEPEKKTTPLKSKKRKKKKSKNSKPSFVSFRSSESLFSATLGGSVGFGNLSGTGSILNDISNGISYTGIPTLNLDFRRSLGVRQKIYFRIGVSAELGNYSTDISSFAHTASSVRGYTNNASIDGSARSNSGEDQVEVIQENDGINEAEIYILNDNNASIMNGEERVSTYLISLSPGLSIKFFESSTVNSSLFLDLGGNVNFLLPAGNPNISYTGIIENGILLPTSELFPRESVLDNISIISDNNNQILEAYRTDDEDTIDNLSGSSTSNIHYSLYAGLTYHRRITTDFGLELGAAYHYGLSALVSASSNDGVGFLEGNLNDSRTASIIEQFYSDTSINRISFRLGLYFRINQD